MTARTERDGVVEERFGRLNSADDLKFVIDWMVKNGSSQKYAEECRDAFLRSVAVSFGGSGLITDRTAVLPEQADEFLHNFLLFNADYAKWCHNNLPDGLILYHFPGMASASSWNEMQIELVNAFGSRREFAEAGTSSVSIKPCPGGIGSWPSQND